MKSIGVVVPVYNTATYLRQCIDSILEQKYNKLSVILVDDGSNDGSAEICDEYEAGDSRVKVIHQKNCGKLAARYRGVCEIECDYITFVDSDDWISSNTYISFLNQMEKDIDVISWRIIRYYNKEKQILSEHNYVSGYYADDKYYTEVQPSMIWLNKKNRFGIDPSLCNKLIKRDLLLNSLENAQILNIGYGDDVAVIYPLLRNSKSLFLSDACLYYHRQRPLDKIADYLIDKEYQEKLFSLYLFLRAKFCDSQNYLEQIDMFYTNSVFLTYGKKRFIVKDRPMYIFPFDKVPSGKKIVLYGASVVGQAYWEQLSAINYADEILWVDRNYEAYYKWNVRSLESLSETVGYDYAVIAIWDDIVATEVKEYLSSHLPDSNTKIIWSVKSI